MAHHASARFWKAYHDLPDDVRMLADKCYEQLEQDPHTPSLQLKKVGRFWSARVGLRYRALAIEVADGLLWYGLASMMTTSA